MSSSKTIKKMNESRPVFEHQGPILEIKDLRVSYGAIQAVKGVSLTVGRGELVALIGSNGAGKTTTLNAVSGTLPFSGGSIRFEGAETKGMGAWNIVSAGMAMVPEGRGVFTRMSILENLQMGAYLREDSSRIEEDMQEIFAIFPRLKEREHQLAGTLSGGEQQMLAMGRALMSRPKLVLLDEPSMGLSPLMVDKIFEVIADISKKGVSILLVEQNAQRALQIADTAYVIESGSIAYSGNAVELLDDARIKASYLGED
jgi:branched-chain amino acid transport system ATP-binding protein